jgi:hypothetical protein
MILSERRQIEWSARKTKKKKKKPCINSDILYTCYVHVMYTVDVVIMTLHGSYKLSILQSKDVNFVVTTTCIYMTICLTVQHGIDIRLL